MAATYVRNASPSIGPSIAMGAAIPVARKPAVNTKMSVQIAALQVHLWAPGRASEPSSLLRRSRQ